MKRREIPFHKVYIGEEEIREVVDTLKTGWITTGPKTLKFEEEFARYVGAKYAVAVNSCTAALHLALEAFGVKEGDEVIVPTMTFTATAEVVVYMRAKPVLVDSEPETLNMDPEKVREKINSKTKVIIPVHYAGHPVEMDEIMDMSSKYGIKVVEDAAHALPSKYKDKFIGTIGDITAFSFYSTKTLTTGEGGMATTEVEKYADRMRIMRLHGMDREAWKRYTSEGSWYYEVIDAGFKYNLSDIASSLGLAQLKKVDLMWKMRRHIAERYTELLKDIEEVETPIKREYVQHSWHLYVIRLNLDMLRIKRSAFIEEMKRRGIGCSVHFIPLHLHPFYRRLGYRREDFPVATREFQRIVSLPIYPGMDDEDIEYVVDAIHDIVKRFRR
jgi:perosamine synthetase